MTKKKFKNIEWSILICTVILIIISLIALYSATLNTEHDEFRKQIIWISISIPILFIVMLIDYELIARLSPILFAVSIALLIGVLFTQSINGSTRWFDFGFFSFQPTEISKIFFLIFLAYIINKLQSKGVENINKIMNLCIVAVIIMVPAFVIAIQPDIGDAILFVIIGVLMLFVAQIKARYVIISILTIIIAAPLLYFTILPSHAKDRIDVYLNPELDPRGKGYNAIQSKLAIGSGRLTGMGLFNGTQTQLGYLYPKTTDFIYAAISEEMGFIVSAGVIILNVIIITKSINIAKTARDSLGSYIGIGIVAMFIYHMTENIGMTMGLLPITGVPLLFVSYGGSSIVTNFIALGLLLNISGKKKDNFRNGII